MLSYLSASLPAASVFAAVAPSPLRAIAFVLAGLLALAVFWVVLWMLPIQAWFRKRIEENAQCPHCGSKDIRNSHNQGVIDPWRKRIGLHPFRCRGCAQRFYSRSSRHANDPAIAALSRPI